MKQALGVINEIIIISITDRGRQGMAAIADCLKNPNHALRKVAAALLLSESLWLL